MAFEYYERIRTDDYYYQVTITSNDMENFLVTSENTGVEEVLTRSQLLDEYPELDYLILGEDL